MATLTTLETVRKYGVHPNVLNRVILMGRVAARKDENGRWMINKSSLEKWDRTRVRRKLKSERVSNGQATPVGMAV
jgi:predicted site-specific integrase-resolvase